MKLSIFAIILSASATVLAAPAPSCVQTVEEDGTVVKRCAIPWTKNYGEYDEKRDIDERSCVQSVEEDGTVVKRCAIPWTKNYGEYDE
ncbi:hypothetical protein N0V82_001979 [Gnomoniopsis sp. IMI 355080]|nr:hypothetical protein N0V82_001979 [Gnomoniopsis sp. IMI 355080]